MYNMGDTRVMLLLTTTAVPVTAAGIQSFKTILKSFWYCLHALSLFPLPALCRQRPCASQVFSSSGVFGHPAGHRCSSTAAVYWWVLLPRAHLWVKWERLCSSSLVLSTGAFTAVVLWKSRKPKKADWRQDAAADSKSCDVAASQRPRLWTLATAPEPQRSYSQSKTDLHSVLGFILTVH